MYSLSEAEKNSSAIFVVFTRFRTSWTSQPVRKFPPLTRETAVTVPEWDILKSTSRPGKYGRPFFSFNMSPSEQGLSARSDKSRRPSPLNNSLRTLDRNDNPMLNELIFIGCQEFP
jgi:hypothetical protein